MFLQRMEAALARRAAKGTLRATAPGAPGLVDFASNDYLGIARNAALLRAHLQDERLRERADRAGARLGSTGSRLLTGADAAHDAAGGEESLGARRGNAAEKRRAIAADAGARGAARSLPRRRGGAAALVGLRGECGGARDAAAGRGRGII